MTDKEIKHRILEILLYFKNVCNQHNISYSLAYGTLLGAVRHGGFIPWDDDVDVCLLREDYEKLIGVLRENEDSRFKLIYAGNNDTYFYNFAKIVDSETMAIEPGNKNIEGYGLYIDIFPLDNCPAEEKEFNSYVKKIKKASLMRSASVCKGKNPTLSTMRNFCKMLISPFAKLFGFKYWVKKEEALILKYRNQNTGYVVCLEEYPVYREIMDIDKLNFNVEIEFEGEKFSCFDDYDGYLKNRYGNYMQLPPVESRVSHHSYVAKIKEN